jgi:hypothetical protein
MNSTFIISNHFFPLMRPRFSGPCLKNSALQHANDAIDMKLVVDDLATGRSLLDESCARDALSRIHFTRSGSS